MILSRHGREFLKLTLATDPPVAGWEASFDRGTTWHDGEATGDPDGFRWLIAGAAADQGAAVAKLAVGYHDVEVRVVDNPEIPARPAGYVLVE